MVTLSNTTLLQRARISQYTSSPKASNHVNSSKTHKEVSIVTITITCMCELEKLNTNELERIVKDLPEESGV